MTIQCFTGSMHYVCGDAQPIDVSVRQHTRIRGLYVVEKRSDHGYLLETPYAYVADDHGTLVQIDRTVPIAHSLRDGAGYLEATLFN